MHQGRILLAVVGLLLFMPTLSRAQDSLDSIIKSKDISRSQEATMEAEVALRFRRLLDAKSPDSRESARERIIKTASTPGASPAGLAAYAKICAAESINMVSGDSLDQGTDGVIVLTSLENANTADALAEALKSRHAVVRLMAARGIVQLHAKLKDDASKCRRLLAALGRAGAAEQDSIVLRVIYQAIDFKAKNASFKHASESADALVAVLEARLSMLEGGLRDETSDESAVDAAMHSYGDAGKSTQSKLISAMSRYLAVCVDRYFDPDTASDYLPTLGRLAGRIDDAIRKMAADSKASISCDKLKLSPKSAGNKKQHDEAVKVVDCISTALSGDPWNVR